MQINSRDLIRPKTRGKSLSRNRISLQKEGFNLTGTGHVLMTTAKELFLVIVKYFIDSGNKRFLPLVPSSPIKVIAFFKVSF